jgi:hypothetical protein
MNWLAMSCASPHAVASASMAPPKAASVSAIGLHQVPSARGRTPRTSAAPAYSGQHVSSSESGQLTSRPARAVSMSGPQPVASWSSVSSASSG